MVGLPMHTSATRIGVPTPRGRCPTMSTCERCGRNADSVEECAFGEWCLTCRDASEDDDIDVGANG